MSKEETVKDETKTITDDQNVSQKNLNIAVNHKYFTTSLLEIIDIVKAKSEQTDLSLLDKTKKQDKKIKSGHERLRLACDELTKGFTDKNDFDQGKIIKKIYRVMTEHLDKFFPEPSKELFSLKNEENATVTIIPGLDIQIVTKTMTDEEMDKLWNHMYMMYISAVVMITEINEHKKDGKVWTVLPKMREKVMKSGMFTKDGKLFNPFFGLMPEGSKEDKENYNVETMFENVDDIQTPSGPSIDDMFKLAGIENMVDVDQLNDQLKNVGRADMDEAIKHIGKLMGTENDAESQEVYRTLVEGIVDDFKTNQSGVGGMAKTVQRVSEKIGKTIDKQKMGKVAGQLNNFLQNGEENLKHMKDNKGNPIGENIMASLKGPLEMAQMATKGGATPNFGEMAAMMTQVTQAMNMASNSAKPTKSKKTSKSSSKK